jgi:thiosulfate dehydrogenase [quinone] large subunit
VTIFYLALVRIGLGFIFLWAFLDKTFGLGFSTEPSRAWIAGGSPTTGYLANATHGPFADFFKALAGNSFVDLLFMLGLLFVGVSFMLGIALRLGGYSGALMLLLMYLSAFPPENNPIVDDHIIYGMIMIAISYSDAGNILGFSKSWAKTGIAKAYPILRD